MTAMGRTFRVEIDRLWGDADAAVRVTQQEARGEIGAISVGFMGPAMRLILPRMVRYGTTRAVIQPWRFPLHEVMPDRQMAAFREGRLNVGFPRSFGEQMQELCLAEELIYLDRIVAAVPAVHALAARRRVNFKQQAVSAAGSGRGSPRGHSGDV